VPVKLAVLLCVSPFRCSPVDSGALQGWVGVMMSHLTAVAGAEDVLGGDDEEGADEPLEDAAPSDSGSEAGSARCGLLLLALAPDRERYEVDGIKQDSCICT